MGLVVTISSGIESRTPTVHRIFLSRKELDPESESLIRGQLLLNKSLIRISEEGFNHLCSEQLLTPKFIECFQHHMRKKNYYEIREDSLMELPNNYILLQNLCILRKHSTAPRDNKINQNVISNIFHRIIEHL